MTQDILNKAVGLKLELNRAECLKESYAEMRNATKSDALDYAIKHMPWWRSLFEDTIEEYFNHALDNAIRDVDERIKWIKMEIEKL